MRPDRKFSTSISPFLSGRRLVMETRGAILGHCQRDAGGLLLAVVGFSFLVARTPATGPAWGVSTAAADVLSESGARPGGDSPAPPDASRSSSSSMQEQIAALKQEQLELARKLLAEFPNREGALVLIGNVLQFQARGDEADEYWKRALQVNPKRADVYWSLGQRAMLAGNYAEAVSSWRKVLELDPRMPMISGNLALALMGLGQHQEAVDVLEQGRQAGILSAFDYFVLGQGYLQLGQLDKAGACYEAAIQLEPNHTNAHYGLFTVCSRLGQRSKAHEHLATFQKLKAQEMKVLKDRNDVHSDLLEVRDRVAETYVTARQLYRDPLQAGKAEQLLQRALEIDPSHVTALRGLAEFYLAAGRGAEAEKAYRALIQAAPGLSAGYRELAWLYLRSRTRLPEARQLAEKAVALEPLAVNYFVLSRAYDQNGDAGRALSALKKAVDLEPANSSYRQTYERLRARESQR
jgi:tetratricopeptide (TPR) repeat protein